MRSELPARQSNDQSPTWVPVRDGPGRMPTTRISSAIQDCLERCRGAETPLARLALFFDDLRQTGWSEPEIRTVETAVVRLLGRIIDPPAEILNCPKCDWPDPVLILRTDAEAIYRCSECQINTGYRNPAVDSVRSRRANNYGNFSIDARH